jgi:YVTN family beta-propeller protein
MRIVLAGCGGAQAEGPLHNTESAAYRSCGTARLRRKLSALSGQLSAPSCGAANPGCSRLSRRRFVAQAERQLCKQSSLHAKILGFSNTDSQSVRAYFRTLLGLAISVSLCAQSQSLPNTGQEITPLAPPGARFEYLNPGLADMPDWVAGQAASAVTSSDKKTLLVLTTGYNLVNFASGTRLGANNPANSTEYIFIYDISSGSPVKKQVLKVPNTYNGIVFDPSGKAFYVPGGVDDTVHTYSLGSNGAWSEDSTSPIKLNHAAAAGLSLKPEAAGIDITKDGSKLVVTNYYNDSITILTRAGNGWSVSAELDLRPGKTDSTKSGVPGGEYPFWVTIKGNDTAYVSSIRDREIVAVDIAGNPAVIQRIKVTGQPLKMTLNSSQTTLYAAEDQSDSVAIIDTTTNQLLQEVLAGAPAGVLSDSRAQYLGHGTNSVTLSPDESQLYVTNGNMNDVAIIDRASLQVVVALVPTGWYPNAAVFSGDGKTVYVVNGKSPTGPNASYCRGNIVPALPSNRCAAANQYSLQLIKAGLQTFPVPDATQYAALTEQVAANNHFRRDLGDFDQTTMSFLRDNIKHVIYIIKENRTYDQVLGDLEVGNGDPALTEYGQRVTPNEHALARTFVTLDNFYDSSEVSFDGWAYSTGAIAPDVVKRQVTVNYASRGLSYDTEGLNRNVNVSLATLAERRADNRLYPNDPDLLPGQVNTASPDGPGNEANTGYLWNQALRAGLTVRNYGFFVSNVGSTVLDPFAAGRTTVSPANAALNSNTDLYYRGFDLNLPDFYRYREWAREYDVNVAAGQVPNLTLIRMGTDHTGNFSTALARVNTPELQVADNDYAVGLLIQKVAQSPYASSTLIFVIEDDAQNGGDHVDAHRSIAFIVGPYVKQGAVVSTPYNTIGMLRTMEEVLGLQPLNLNDSLAMPMTDVFDVNQPADWTYAATPSALLYNTDLPLPPAPQGLRIPRPTHDARYWAKVTKGMNFDDADELDFAAYNRIVWKGLKGKQPYPDKHYGRRDRLE